VSGYGSAIYGEHGAVELSDLVLVDNENSIDVVGRLTASRIVANSNRHGVRASGTMRLSDVSVSNSGGDGILGPRIVGDGVTVSNCHTAVSSNGRVRLTGLTSTSNLYGVVARRIVLTDSVLGAGDPDVLSVRRPVLVDTVCETSSSLVQAPGGFVNGPTWGVCAND